MKIMVTGANGYIGVKVVENLLKTGNEVIAVDIDNSNLNKNVNFIKCDIFNAEGDIFTKLGSPDVCLHLAWRNGFVHNASSHFDDLPYHYKFLCNLIDGGLKRIACMGTMHEVGYHEGVIDENTPCNPQSLYGISKNALRKALELYANSKGCAFQWLRGYYIYGNNGIGNSVFSKIYNAAKNGQETFPLTSGKNEYDFISVDELAKQISAAITQSEVLGIINCCSGIHISLKEEIESFVKNNKLNIKLEYGKFPDRPYDSPCIYGDNSKIKKIMNK